MRRPPTVVRHPDDLDSLSVAPGFRTPGRGPIRLDAGHALDPAVSGKFETRLNRLYFACGCDQAALGTVIGLVGYVAWLAAKADGWSSFEWRDLWFGFVAVAIATAVGKLIGRRLADRAFHQAVRELKHVWNAPATRSGSGLGRGSV